MYFQKLEEKIRQKSAEFNLKRIRLAYQLAEKAHHGQKRKSGEDYIIHPVAVAEMIFEIGGDEESIIAALLHDTVEDTLISIESITHIFGPEVGHIVDGLTRLRISLNEHVNERAEFSQNLRKMFEFMADDIRIIVIKLMDRLHNLQTLQYVSDVKKNKKIQQTFDIFQPIATLLGMWQVKQKLEDTCFSHLNTPKYAKIKTFREKYRIRHQQKLHRLKLFLEKKLSPQKKNIRVQIEFQGLYEIEKHLQKKNLQISDYKAPFIVTIILPNHDNCYHLLQHLHQLCRPLHNNLKDYISHPKINSYRALHTTVVGPHHQLLNIRILTKKMYQFAQDGILQDLYSPKKNSLLTPDWLQNILQISEAEKDPQKFLDQLETNIFTKKIHITSKRGHVTALPKGASGIDLFCLQSSDISSKLVFLKINGKSSHIRCRLDKEDIAEICQSSRYGRSVHCLWLLFCKTFLAKKKIKESLQSLPQETAITFGEQALSRELKMEYRIPLSAVPKQRLQECSTAFGCKNFSHLLERIGRGEMLAYQVYQKLFLPTNEQNSKALHIEIVGLQDRNGLLYDIISVFYRNNAKIIDLKGFSPPPRNTENITCQVTFLPSEQTNTYAICNELQQVRDIGDVFIRRITPMLPKLLTK